MEIRRTSDHSIFKHLVGNRTVARSRVEKIGTTMQSTLQKRTATLNK